MDEERGGGVAGKRRESNWCSAGTMSKMAGGMEDRGVLLR